MFHQVFLQLLFILSWKLARRGHFKISKKKKVEFSASGVTKEDGGERGDRTAPGNTSMG